MDNDKFQELVLQQLQSINQRIGNLENGQNSLKEGQTRLETRMNRLEKSQVELMAVKADVHGVKDDVLEVKSTVTRIEQEHGTQLEALMDGYKQNAEILDRHTEQLNRIESKIESHDIQISILDQTKANKRKAK